jgi:hypothetical protein
MLKKTAVVIFASSLLFSSIVITSVHAASVSNGASCSKIGASATARVKGVSKAYICKVNPAVAAITTPTWTLKTCLTYWAAAQNSQNSINDQRSLVSSMSEPDKTTYSKQLDASQAQLDKVKSAIVANHCKAGL